MYYTAEGEKAPRPQLHEAAAFIRHQADHNTQHHEIAVCPWKPPGKGAYEQAQEAAQKEQNQKDQELEERARLEGVPAASQSSGLDFLAQQQASGEGNSGFQAAAWETHKGTRVNSGSGKTVWATTKVYTKADWAHACEEEGNARRAAGLKVFEPDGAIARDAAGLQELQHMATRPKVKLLLQTLRMSLQMNQRSLLLQETVTAEERLAQRLRQPRNNAATEGGEAEGAVRLRLMQQKRLIRHYRQLLVAELLLEPMPATARVGKQSALRFCGVDPLGSVGFVCGTPVSKLSRLGRAEGAEQQRRFLNSKGWELDRRELGVLAGLATRSRNRPMIEALRSLSNLCDRRKLRYNIGLLEGQLLKISIARPAP
jgi:hypothetical protein